MKDLTHFKPVDYLLVGHITQDLTDSGSRLGGTATFSGLTARILGHSVGIVTSCHTSTDFHIYENIQICNFPSEESTTFRNISSEGSRTQYLYHKALPLDMTSIPAAWKKTPIIHLGPVANEIDSDIINHFPDSLMLLTPQGWLRQVDPQGKVHPIPWNLPPELTAKATAIVLSSEDIQDDEDQITELARHSNILIVTENKYGARVYWREDVRRFSAPQVDLVDATGAGDIFAAAFFSRLAQTRDPWESTRFAVKLSASSVTRSYLQSIPTKDEIASALVDIN